MTREAAAVADGTGEGAGGDAVTVGEVEGDTEGLAEDKSGGGIDVAAVVSEQQRQQQQLWPPSWECC